jgi:acyl transferase domain-containing protein
MGRELSEAFPAFGQALEDICAHLDPELNQVMFTDPDRLGRNAFGQPAVFAVEVALFRLLECMGVSADFLMGHSMGEIAAAHVAGVLSLEDSCRLVTARGRLMDMLPAGGAMISVRASEGEMLARLPDGLSIAAINGPDSVVISGPEDLAVEVAAGFTESRRIAVTVAGHSRYVDEMLSDFGRVTEGLTYSSPRIPIISTVTGELATAQELCSPDYWVRNVRMAVRFLHGMRELEKQGVKTYMELSPDSVLASMAEACLTEGTDGVAFIPLLRANQTEVRSTAMALATAHVRGLTVDWSKWFARSNARRVELPTYAFQRKRYWATSTTRPVCGAGPDVAEARFWKAVEGQDISAAAETLEVTEEEAGSALGAILPTLAKWRQSHRDKSVVDGWRYHISWKPIGEPPPSAPFETGPSGHWLVVIPPDHATTHWPHATVRALTDHGVKVRELVLDKTNTDRAILARRLRDCGAVDGVLSLLGLSDHPHPEHPVIPVGVALTLALSNALGDADVPAPLWLATRQAVSVDASDAPPNPALAQLWGLGAVVGLEHPQRWGGLIDLPAEADEDAVKRLLAILVGSTGEDQIAIRGGRAFVRRLRSSPSSETKRRRTWRPTGTVLVTGGTGALGAHVARWLARNGAAHLVLVSRRGLAAPRVGELRTELEQLGATVTIAACDVGDRAALTTLVEQLEGAGSPIRAVVHAAGSAPERPLVETELADLVAAADAKVGGARNLDAVLNSDSIEAFVLFSSAAGIWGGRNQAAYAAANAYLDALAQERRARGLSATSVAWGQWAGAGMGANALLAPHFRRSGFRPMASGLATQALGFALDDDETTLAMVDVNWATFLSAFTAARPRHLFDELPEATERREPVVTENTTSAACSMLRERLAALPEGTRREHLLGLASIRGRGRVFGDVCGVVMN